MATRAYILVSVEPPSTQAVVARLKAAFQSRVREVLGPYDLVIELEADTPEDLTRVVRSKVRPIPGVSRTVTCLALNGAL